MTQAVPAPPTTSVVVVSRGRPSGVRRTLLSLRQQDHPALECVVVADASGLAAIRDLPFFSRLKTVEFDVPNISAARNRGLDLAAGDVIAFIDDDAVAEPTWIRRLAAPFADTKVQAATGFVRGRNGISWQWKAMKVDGLGQDHPMEVPAQASFHHPQGGRATKTVGTNAAFRRQALVQLGGFDPAFHFFLDETDLNMRLAAAGMVTAVVPDAVVHHQYSASPRRARDRTPRDLSQIGASLACFLRLHCAETDQQAARDRARAEQRRRLLAHVVAGGLEPRDVHRLLDGFDAGFVQGSERALRSDMWDAPGPPAFRAMPVPTALRCFCAGYPFERSKLHNQARAVAEAGGVATVLLLSPSVRYMQVSFSDEGIWWHRGGTFGRVSRDGPHFRLRSFRRAAEVERLRVAKFRQ